MISINNYLLCFVFFPKFFYPLYFPKQIKNGLGVTEMFYLSMKIIVCYIHQQHLSTTLFLENIFFLEMKSWIPEKFPKIIPTK